MLGSYYRVDLTQHPIAVILRFGDERLTAMPITHKQSIKDSELHKLIESHVKE